MRGPNVMKGYLNNPKATNDTFLDGWLRTGDIVKVDEEGYFFVTDRLKELIKFKGLQVAPAELEGILLSHPHVQDSAVIPQNDEAAGEVPKAYVVLKPEVPATKATADAIASFVESKVAPHKVRRIVVVNLHLIKRRNFVAASNSLESFPSRLRARSSAASSNRRMRNASKLSSRISRCLCFSFADPSSRFSLLFLFVSIGLTQIFDY